MNPRLHVDELRPREKDALGGLIRLLMGGPHSFDRAAAGRPVDGDLMSIVSRSIADCPDEASIRAAARAVERSEARTAIVETLSELAQGDGLEAREAALLRWLDDAWR